MAKIKNKRPVPLKWKAFRLVMTVAVVIALFSSVACYRVFSNVIEDHYIRVATNVAETAACFMDGDQVERFRDKVISAYEKIEDPVDTSQIGTQKFEEYASHFAGIEDEDYEQIHSTLCNMLKKNDLDSVYLVCAYEPDKILLYIADSSDTQSLFPGAFDLIEEGDLYLFDTPEAGIAADVSITPEYGYICCVMIPLYNSTGQIVAYSGVDISMNEINDVRIAFLQIILVLLAVVTVILSYVAFRVINRRLVAPVNQLAAAAKNYVKGKGSDGKHTFETVSIHTGDELEDLGNAMIRMEKDIDVYIADLTRVTAEKERIGAELDVAKKIQADMLPNIFPAFPDRKDISVYATMTPAKEVGGDFYDYFFTDPDHFAIVMADVSGKGVPAALFMVIAKTLIKNRALMGGTPAEIFTDVNHQLCESNGSEMFVTAWLAIIDLKTGKVLTANAGHEYPAVRRKDGEYHLIESKHSIALAAIDCAKYRDNEYELHDGDSLFVYTDGVTEATNANDELFGNDRLIAALNISPDAEPETILPQVKDEIDKFVNGAPQFDDITMLGFRYNKRI